MDHQVYMKEQGTDELWLFRLGYLADSFLKMNTVCPSPQGKQGDTCCQQKNVHFQVKIRILDSFPILKDFSNDISGEIKKCDFF